MPPKQKKKIGRPRKLFQLEELEKTPPPTADPAMPLETLANAAEAAQNAQSAQLPQPTPFPPSQQFPQPYPFSRPPHLPHAEPAPYTLQQAPIPPAPQYPLHHHEGYPVDAPLMSRPHHHAPTPSVPQPAQFERNAQPWERLYNARASLDSLRKLPATSLSSENHLEITDAINYLYHILSPGPTDIPDTPRHYSFEFKNQAATLTAEYVMFCLDAVPEGHVARKLFLDNVHEKLIKPITAREYIWGDLGIRLNEAWIKWDEYNRNLLGYLGGFPQSPARSHDQSPETSPSLPAIDTTRDIRRPMMSDPRRPTSFERGSPQPMPPPPRNRKTETSPEHYAAQGYSTSTNPRFRAEMEVDPHSVREQTEDVNQSEDGDGFEPMPPPIRNNRPQISSYIGHGRRLESVPPQRMVEDERPADHTVTATRSGDKAPYVQSRQGSRGETVPAGSLESSHPHTDRQPTVEVKVELPLSKESRNRSDGFTRERLADVTPEDNLATKKGSEKRIVSDTTRPPSIAYSLGINEGPELHHAGPQFNTPPKRPASRSLDDAPPTKQQRTTRISKPIPRMKSTEELRLELEKQHQEDEEFMASQTQMQEGEEDSHESDRPAVIRSLRRSMSRNDVEIVRCLTPALQGLNTSGQLGTSPPRQTWQTPSPQGAPSPSDAPILPRGGNALGVQSHGILGFDPQSTQSPEIQLSSAATDPTRFNDHHHVPQLNPGNLTAADPHVASSDTSELDPETMTEIAEPRVGMRIPQPCPPPSATNFQYRPDTARQSVPVTQERKRSRLDNMIDDDIKHQIQPQPKSTFELVELMKKHDCENRCRPIHLRSFYVPQWGLRLASWDPTRAQAEDDDGERVIEFVRYFDLEPRDIAESNRYIRFIRGEEARGPKTMIRLRFALIPAGGNGEEVSSWPPNTHLLFNGQYLRTPQDSPLYISFVNLKDVNKLRVTLDLEQLQGACFKLYLEFFSVVDYHELEEYMEKNSPSLAEAKEILGKAVPAAAKTKSGDWEVQIPLVCPGHEQQLGPMKKPVYGRSCNHLERLDLDCFLSNVDVSPTFEWKCPLCKADCGLDWPLPIYSDKLVKGIIRTSADQVHSPPRWFRLSANGLLSGDDGMDLDPGQIGASRFL